MTQKIKALAQELGADLVGFANIGRFDEAPIKMSPKGIMPTAKSVIVCAIHYPDATIELVGGKRGDSQKKAEAYAIGYMMNNKLDHISFSIGRFLDQNGYNAVPIVGSNIWRYRNYKELNAVFSPDMSHIYASVCAGLSEMGWNGLALTPEYGSRNRFVSIITDAELEPTPLLPGGTLCDMCGECIRHCPTDAYRKDVNGVKMLNIRDADGKVYTHKFANKNLWRCAWGEHFGIDLDDDVPDVINEDVIVQRVTEKGRIGCEMGVCLKVCVPPHMRFRDESYSPFNRRKRPLADPELAVRREVYDRMSAIALKYHVDRITVFDAQTLLEKGCDLAARLPGAKNLVVLSAIVPAVDATTKEELAVKHNEVIDVAIDDGLGYAELDISRYLEKLGYSPMPSVRSLVSFIKDEIRWDLAEGDSVASKVIITDAPLENRDWFIAQPASEESDLPLKQLLQNTAVEYGADMMGVAPASRVDNIVRQLRPIKDGEVIYDAEDKNEIFMPYNPVITESSRKLYRPEDYLEGARSVIVLGVSYPAESARSAGREPAEAVGPFIFAQSQAQNELSRIAYEVLKTLRRNGKKAILTRDLIGMGTPICSPRGDYSSPFDCSFEAAAAGLGQVTYSGSLYTEEYGVNQRFVCIVTDAVLEADPVQANTIQEDVCVDCRQCISACPLKALKEAEAVEIEIDGNAFRYVPLDTVSCQWASRYVLNNGCGEEFLGSKLALLPNGKITPDQLIEGLKMRDPITKFRPGNSEKCIMECPLI